MGEAQQVQFRIYPQQDMAIRVSQEPQHDKF